MSVLILALLVAASVPNAPAPPSTPGIEGHWSGVIQIRPGEFEVDLTLDAHRKSDGSLTGEISYPTQGPQRYTLQSLAVQGQQVSFTAVDEYQVKSIFEGTLASDGKSIEGDLAEGQQHYPFTLARGEAAIGKPAAVQTLSSGGSELIARFNEDKDQVRLVLILSPT